MSENLLAKEDGSASLLHASTKGGAGLLRFGSREEARRSGGFAQSGFLRVGSILDLGILEHAPTDEAIVERFASTQSDCVRYQTASGSEFWVPKDRRSILVVTRMPAEQMRHPAELDEESFIGPSIVMDVFEIDGEEEEFSHLVELLDEDGDNLPLIASQEGWSVRWVPEWEPDATVGLFCPEGRPRGFYMGGMVWIEEQARGLGLSSMMINAVAELVSGSPTRNTEGLGFSPSGFAAHQAAYRNLVKETHLSIEEGLELS